MFYKMSVVGGVVGCAAILVEPGKFYGWSFVCFRSGLLSQGSHLSLSVLKVSIYHTVLIQMLCSRLILA